MATDHRAGAPPTGRGQQSGRLIAGLALIVLGVFAFAGQFIDEGTSGRLFLVGLSLAFLVWGAAARIFGLLIPGGILLGIGVGAFLIDGPFSWVGDPAQGGIFFLAFAGGWALITLASAVFTDRIRLWPLIIAAILGVIGLALLAGGPVLTVLRSLENVWPIALIAVGLYLLLRHRGSQA